jgi:Fe-S cluster assembly protein SufD
MKTIVVDLTQAETKVEIDSDCEVLGLFVGKNQDKISTNLKVIHSQPGLRSRTTIKAVLYDESVFNFTGDLIINNGAKQTDTYLKVDVLMLSSNCKATAVPSLEIMEDEVKGGHGATVGQLDRDQIFYLLARGLSDAEAKQILVDAFISDISDKITSAQK